MRTVAALAIIAISTAFGFAQEVDPKVLATERDQIRLELLRRAREWAERQIRPLSLKDLSPGPNVVALNGGVTPAPAVPKSLPINKPIFSSFTDKALIEKLLKYDVSLYRNIGDDDRIQKFEALQSTNVILKTITLRYSEGVAALFVDDDLVDNKDGTSKVIVRATLGEQEGLCPGSRFEKEPVVAFGTGFLVRSNLLVTAGHCIYEIGHQVEGRPINKIRAVFGWECDQFGMPPIRINNTNIFEVSVVDGEFTCYCDKPDWAVLKLSRNSSRPVLPIRTSGSVANHAQVTSFGFPSGIPLKAAGLAFVDVNTNLHTFTSSLDVYAGNSGSPVLNSDGLVEGIVSWGGIDYTMDTATGCRIALSVPDTGLRGFYCTRIGRLRLP